MVEISNTRTDTRVREYEMSQSEWGEMISDAVCAAAGVVMREGVDVSYGYGQETERYHITVREDFTKMPDVRPA